MSVLAMKTWAGLVGGAAVAAAVAVCLLNSAATQTHDIAGGSGNSATGTQYTQPVVPTMSMGSSVTMTATPTVETAGATLATSVASPTYKAQPPSGF